MKRLTHLFVLLLLFGIVQGSWVGAEEATPGLSFVFPYDGRMVAGTNVLVWVTLAALPPKRAQYRGVRNLVGRADV